MILLLIPDDDDPEPRAAESFADFASAIHSRVPDFQRTAGLQSELQRERGICGEHNRVVPTRQGLCPICAGRLHDPEEIARQVAAVRWGQAHGLYDVAGVERLRLERYVKLTSNAV